MCTGISYSSTDQQEFFGRTQEYNLDYDYVVAQFPSEFHVQLGISDWQTRYSVLGMGTRLKNELMPMVLDGVNGSGLAGSTQYFAVDDLYQPLKNVITAGKKPIYAEQFIFYLLSMCQNITEVKAVLKKVAIPDQSIVQATGLPQHFFIKDATGASIVIEPDATVGFKVYDNSIGVMTNAPAFDWQVTNLRQYAGLTAALQPDLPLRQMNLTAAGKGAGLLGLPGDFTSTSRFVKASLLLNLMQLPTATTAVETGFHLLSLSDIPKGTMLCADGSVEYTQYTVIYNQTKRELYLKLYENLAIQKVTYQDNDAQVSDPRVYELNKTASYQVLN
ncbi:hypothetical protein C5Z25_03550 [Lactobacillus sp. CBA3605]|uniref:linear amide C-N hydrolase n=1 Tax=Lactobacillus sp. CBA3605 TaxID=2099788 RepID=UPI000CFD6D57|nr:linear amide C-N hydrolase [Lactobacillus sp. CBA3605]AVK60882.1 hypothetical protein C5Z25_03550 [Lactobacillus sp. CBA3605]